MDERFINFQQEHLKMLADLQPTVVPQHDGETHQLSENALNQRLQNLQQENNDLNEELDKLMVRSQWNR